jgi:hypothetical protein
MRMLSIYKKGKLRIKKKEKKILFFLSIGARLLLERDRKKILIIII